MRKILCHLGAATLLAGGAAVALPTAAHAASCGQRTDVSQQHRNVLPVLLCGAAGGAQEQDPTELHVRHGDQCPQGRRPGPAEREQDLHREVGDDSAGVRVHVHNMLRELPAGAEPRTFRRRPSRTGMCRSARASTPSRAATTATTGGTSTSPDTSDSPGRHDRRRPTASRVVGFRIRSL